MFLTAASFCRKADTIDILIKTLLCLVWARDEWTNVHCGDAANWYL